MPNNSSADIFSMLAAHGCTDAELCKNKPNPLQHTIITLGSQIESDQTIPKSDKTQILDELTCLLAIAGIVPTCNVINTCELPGEPSYLDYLNTAADILYVLNKTGQTSTSLSHYATSILYDLKNRVWPYSA